MSRTQIAIVADVGVATVANVANQLHRTTHRTIADKILTVRPRIVRDTDRLDAVGTRRRLQALYAIGHSYRTLTAATGISDGTIRNIVASRAREVTATTYKSVRDAYLALRYQPGTSTRTVHSARENGWHTPDQWDDLGRIDDPSCQLETGEKPLTRNELAALRREEILHLTRFGATPEQIQTRLANDDLSLSHIRAVVAELRTGRKKDRRKQAVAS
jgi:hypothetical protein